MFTFSEIYPECVCESPFTLRSCSSRTCTLVDCDADCPEWSNWSGCDINNIRHRQRTCRCLTPWTLRLNKFFKAAVCDEDEECPRRPISQLKPSLDTPVSVIVIFLIAFITMVLCIICYNYCKVKSQPANENAPTQSNEQACPPTIPELPTKIYTQESAPPYTCKNIDLSYPSYPPPTYESSISTGFTP